KKVSMKFLRRKSKKRKERKRLSQSKRRGDAEFAEKFTVILGLFMLLKNQVALITGSGRGIGRAMALLFAKEGAGVFLTARTEKELSATAEEITKAVGREASFAGDLGREA